MRLTQKVLELLSKYTILEVGEQIVSLVFYTNVNLYTNVSAEEVVEIPQKNCTATKKFRRQLWRAFWD